jgi:hypothetical protein
MQFSRVEDVLAAWRAAERRMAEAEHGSLEWQAARAEVSRRMSDYQAAVAADDAERDDEWAEYEEATG